ncbi:hypothetical protein AAT78_003199 [Salmonella enterica subsp. enterica serovar Miami]|nr:hypothetical protein [Salmonella enterica]EDT7036542.1 hypothetical protein [Salmonella enterica subsp. enterica serovar Miami]EEH6839245.1 hypothetical protein [Salmonella enterica]ELP2130197.1 hypothetical protein [Salmonella enterica subsp. enterica serovar Miami]
MIAQPPCIANDIHQVVVFHFLNTDVRFAPDIVIHTLRVTLLSDSGYALIGYEYCARIM